jgi:DNA polymerase-3 subunit beta
MKFTIDKSAFADALSRCVQIADPKSPMPMLQNVYLSATVTGLLVAATDLHRAIAVQIDGAKVDQPGALCLSARDLFDRVKQLPEGKVAFGAESNRVTLKTVGSSRRFTMSGFPGEEFPSIPSPGGYEEKLDIQSDTLASLIGAVHHSISTDLSRLIYSAMLLEFDAHGARAVSMDGHCLTTLLTGSDPSGSQAGRLPTRWLIPLPAVNDIRKLVTVKDPVSVTLVQDRDTLFLKLGNFTYSAKLVAADFPTWQHGVPKQFERTVTVDRLALINELRAVSVSSSVLTGAVNFTFKKGTLVLESASSSAGEGFDEVPTDYDGETGSVSLSAAYALAALSAVTSDQITISSSSPKDAPVIRAAGSDDFLALVMPLMP